MMNIRETASFVGVSEGWVRRLIHEGRLLAVLVPNDATSLRWDVTEEEATRFRDAQQGRRRRERAR